MTDRDPLERLIGIVGMRMIWGPETNRDEPRRKS
jgi:hypothetical protein